MKFNKEIPKNLTLNQILGSLCVHQKGIAFENEHNHIRPLACLSEGTAGQMLFWALLYQKTSNDILKEIVYGLHKYQKTSWQTAYNNWADYNKHISDIETHWLHINHFDEGNYNFFTNAEDNIDFWNGTKGITYSYLKLYEIFSDNEFLKEANKGLLKLNTNQANIVFDKTVFDNFSLTNTLIKEVTSLTKLQFLEEMIKKKFPQSYLFYIKYVSPVPIVLPDFSIKDITQFKFLNFVSLFFKLQAKTINDKIIRSMFKDIVLHEKKKLELEKKFINRALIRAEELSNNHTIESILKLDNKELLQNQFVLNDRLGLSITKFSWEYFKGTFLPKKESKNVLLLKISKGILEVEVSNIELALLQQFIEPISIERALAAYFKFIGKTKDELNDINVIKNSFEIIRKFIYGQYIQSVS